MEFAAARMTLTFCTLQGQCAYDLDVLTAKAEIEYKENEVMRPYYPNSPQAIARIVALTLVSDGDLDPAELAMLRKVRAFERIGLNEQRFIEVLQGFCEDLLAGTSCDDEECRIDGAKLVRLLKDINDPWVQKETLRLMLDVIRADGKLEHGESLLFWQALDQWKMQISDIVLDARTTPRRDDREFHGKRPRSHVPRSPYQRISARA